MITLHELAELTGAKLLGDGSVVIHNLTKPEQAKENDLCFVLDKNLLPHLKTCQASAVILKPENEALFSGNKLIHSDPYYVYARASTFFPLTEKSTPGIHPSAIIDSSVVLGADVSIAANVVIGKEAVIGEGSVIGVGCAIGEHASIGDFNEILPNATLYSHTKTGKSCRIHSGVVIGDEGFGFAPYEGEWHRIEQMGCVELGDNVEVGANTTIDRGAMSNTVIGDGVKIDNLVQIGHNVQIGNHSIIIACVAIAGSTIIGKSCIIAGAVGIAGHLTIADGVTVTGMSRVSHSLTKPGATYSSGTRLEESSVWRRNAVRMTQLDSMAKQLKALEKKLDKL